MCSGIAQYWLDIWCICMYMNIIYVYIMNIQIWMYFEKKSSRWEIKDATRSVATRMLWKPNSGLSHRDFSLASSSSSPIDKIFHISHHQPKLTQNKMTCKLYQHHHTSTLQKIIANRFHTSASSCGYHMCGYHIICYNIVILRGQHNNEDPNLSSSRSTLRAKSLHLPCSSVASPSVSRTRNPGSTVI